MENLKTEGKPDEQKKNNIIKTEEKASKIYI